MILRIEISHNRTRQDEVLNTIVPWDSHKAYDMKTIIERVEIV